jgi:tripartite-type tricarboxylate transporter receptor subunit TctC
MTDLISGRIDFFCEILSTAKALIDSHKVKAIALMTKQRSPVEPNIPTAEEQGFKGFEAYTWNALFLPKGAPADVVKKLNDAAVKAMNSASVKNRLQALGATIVPANEQTPAFLGDYVKSEIKKWEAPIKASGVSQ